MVITIDGPAGAGKSSVAKALAQRLGFRFLDTGAMYRTVAFAAARRGIDWNNSEQLSDLARTIDMTVSEEAVTLAGEDVTKAIRTMAITSVIHHVADNAEVRGHLVTLQRRIANDGDYVTEGRDQGTVAFPDAACKIFLTASSRERAKRRMKELAAKGESLTFEEVLERQNERDFRDRTRDVGRLMAAVDAIQVSTDNKSMDEVINELEEIARSKIAEAANSE